MFREIYSLNSVLASSCKLLAGDPGVTNQIFQLLVHVLAVHVCVNIASYIQLSS